MLWIEWEEGGARWGTATEGQKDLILAYAEAILGRPDTLT